MNWHYIHYQFELVCISHLHYGRALTYYLSCLHHTHHTHITLAQHISISCHITLCRITFISHHITYKSHTLHIYHMTSISQHDTHMALYHLVSPPIVLYRSLDIPGARLPSRETDDTPGQKDVCRMDHGFKRRETLLEKARVVVTTRCTHLKQNHMVDINVQPLEAETNV